MGWVSLMRALIVFGNSIGSSAARDGARVGIIGYEDSVLPQIMRKLEHMGIKDSTVGLVTVRPSDQSGRPSLSRCAMTASQPPAPKRAAPKARAASSHGRPAPSWPAPQDGVAVAPRACARP